MIVEVLSVVVFPLSAYWLWRYFFGYKRVNVLISCVADDLRRAVTTRIVNEKEGGGDGEWPVRMIGGIMYKTRFGWDEYCFLELNSYPQRFHDFCVSVQVVIFIVDAAQSSQDQKDSLELFQTVMGFKPLKRARLLMYVFRRKEPARNLTDEEIGNVYGLRELTQQWHIQTFAAPSFIGLTQGMEWARKETK